MVTPSFPLFLLQITGFEPSPHPCVTRLEAAITLPADLVFLRTWPGYSLSPFPFCAVTESVAQVLRRRVAGLGIHVLVFVDDFLVIGDNAGLTRRGVQMLMSLLDELGMSGPEWGPWTPPAALLPRIIEPTAVPWVEYDPVSPSEDEMRLWACAPVGVPTIAAALQARLDDVQVGLEARARPWVEYDPCSTPNTPDAPAAREPVEVSTFAAALQARLGDVLVNHSVFA